MTMTSNKPYLIRAMYDWIVDNDLTPYLLVNAEYPRVEVPQEYVNGGRIILNISPKSCRGLHLENDRIVFTTRFSGGGFRILMYDNHYNTIEIFGHHDRMQCLQHRL